MVSCVESEKCWLLSLKSFHVNTFELSIYAQSGWLYAKLIPERTENSFDMECQESLEGKISPCLAKNQIQV